MYIKKVCGGLILFVNNKEIFQVGDTLYIRRDYLKLKSNGADVRVDTYNPESIYEQTTLGSTWKRGVKDGDETPFTYFATQSVIDYSKDNPGSTASNLFRMNNHTLNIAWKYISGVR